MDHIHDAVFAAIGLFITALAVLFRDWFVRKLTPSKNLRRRMQQGLEEQWEVFNALGRITDLPFVDRLMMFEGKNDGGYPRAGRRYSVRSLTGLSKRDGTGPMWKYHEPFPVDLQYIEMLLAICNEDGHGWVRLSTPLLPADSMLRSFYEREGVCGSGVFYVCVQEEEKRMIYISVANYTRELTDSEMREIVPLIGGVKKTLGGE
jgi:hypothetical protein